MMDVSEFLNQHFLEIASAIIIILGAWILFGIPILIYLALTKKQNKSEDRYRDILNN